MASWGDAADDDYPPPLVDAMPSLGGPAAAPYGYPPSWGPSGNAAGSVIPGGFGALPPGGFGAAPGTPYATPYAAQQPQLAWPPSPTSTAADPWGLALPGATPAAGYAQMPTIQSTMAQQAYAQQQQQQAAYAQQQQAYAQQQQQAAYAQQQQAYQAMGTLPPGTPAGPAPQYPAGFFGRDPYTGQQQPSQMTMTPPAAARRFPQNAWWSTPSSSASSTLHGEYPVDDGASAYAGGTAYSEMLGERAAWEADRASMARAMEAASSTPGYSSGPRVIYKRPEEWRRDFSTPRQGLSRLFSTKGSSSPGRSSIARNVKLYFGSAQPHWSLEYTSNPTCIWDIRSPPSQLVLKPSSTTPRPLSYLEQQEAATDPPTNHMRLVHPLLPWALDVAAEPGAIISISHLLTQVYYALQRQVMESDFWNDSLDEEDRKAVYEAWAGRCGGGADRAEAARGLRRVDFLLDRWAFLGIARRGENEWELKCKRHPKLR